MSLVNMTKYVKILTTRILSGYILSNFLIIEQSITIYLMVWHFTCFTVKVVVQLSKGIKVHDKQCIVNTVQLPDGQTVYLQVSNCPTVYIQLSTECLAFVHVSKGRKVYDKQLIVKSIYLWVSDGQTYFLDKVRL